MGKDSGIEWCDHTFNPWVGCTRISSGCDNCYAATWARRSGLVQWDGPPRRTSESAWRQPYKWNSEASRSRRRARVFVASLGDVFDKQVPAEWRKDLWALIRMCGALDFLLLTKRPQNIAAMLPESWPWPNVRLGFTAENQTEFDRRWYAARNISACWFVSAEPLLGHINMAPAALSSPGIDWVIAGGESGPNARPTHPDWVRSLRDQCDVTGTAFFFKQWGEWAPGENIQDQRRYPTVSWFDEQWLNHGKQNGDDWTIEADNDCVLYRAGRAKTGALLDGRGHREMPIK